MATDSTHLPQGDSTFHAGTDMAGGELDVGAVQLAQVEGAQPVVLPKGQQVVVIPVQPGQVIELPTDSAEGLAAKFGPEGNLAIVIDGRTIILQGYLKANDESSVKIVTNDGNAVVPADVVADTDKSLNIITAAGPASGPQGDTAPGNGNGIFTPFALTGIDGLNAVGVLKATELGYRTIDDETKEFVQDEDTSPDFTITFDVLGGIVNEDDLGPDQIDIPQLASAKFIFGGKGGSNGEGNDPFDTEDREDQDGDATPGSDDDESDGVDRDREPTTTVATVKVDFHGDTPGSLAVDPSLLPALTSEGRTISYQILPAEPGVHGNAILAFVDNGGVAGKFDPLFDDVVFAVDVEKDKSDGEFKVYFTLYDNIDSEAPDSLIGKNEQILDLPVKFKITDSDGSVVYGTLPLGVEDDVPFFGQVDDCGVKLEIKHTDVEITHDETHGVQPHSDDVSIYNPFVALLGLKLGIAVDKAGFDFPFGESEGALIGAAKAQVHVSFGADGPAVFIKDGSDEDARNSIFGALEDRDNVDGDGKADGENEHPFELFLVNDGTEGNDGGEVQESHLTIAPQRTNCTVTWGDGDAQKILDVWVKQIDAHTVVGYVQPEEGCDPVAVFTLHIDDNGCLSFYQIHQLNHEVDGKYFPQHDDPLEIKGADGEPLIYVRATDYDGDHTIAPVNLEIQDDGPRFCEVDWGCDGDSVCGVSVIDEDKLPHGDYAGPGDDKGGTHTDGKVVFNFGADKPGHLEINELTVKDCTGKTVLKICVGEDGCLQIKENCLKAIDGKDLEFKTDGPDSDGVVTWTAYIAGCEGEKVFSFSLDTAGDCIGEFDFCLYKPLEHPLTENPYQPEALAASQSDTTSSYEDNFKFDFKVRGFDSDGDHADGHVNLSVDDDSPDACKVEISFGDQCEDNKLVHDESGRKQNGGKFIPGDHDPDASCEDEDDVRQPESFEKFEEAQHCLDAIGYAKTELNVDLSGGSCDPKAAFGADGPGGVSPVSIVNCLGGNFCGEKTNLIDTKCGLPIFLYTVEECGETFVVGKVGGKDGPISFALHVSDCGDLEMAQYRAIKHPDECDRDDSLTLLDCNGNALIHLQVTVTDADGDSVHARQPVDGCHGNPAIVFQDDGPVVECGNGKLVLAMDETEGHGGWPYDQNTPGHYPKDGWTPENDENLHHFAVLWSDLPTCPAPIGAAVDNVQNLFKVDFGTDDGCVVCYDLTILCEKTNLVDTQTGTCITLCKTNDGIVLGKDGCGNIVFAVWLDHDSGKIVSAQYRAIDHGDGEKAPGVHDEVKFLGDDVLGVTATAFDKDGDHDSKTVDIGCGISFDDDGPRFCEVDWGCDDGSEHGTGLIDEDALPHGKPGGPWDNDGGKHADGRVVFDYGSDKAGHLEIRELVVKDATGKPVLEICVDHCGELVIKENCLFAIDNKALCFEKCGPDDSGVVTWTAFIAGCPDQKVFTFSLDTCGDCIGEFDFCLLQPLEHPYHDGPGNGPEKVFEDNFKFDFTIRGYDGDGDSADGHVKLSVDDDSPCVECGEGALRLAMDESVALPFYDDNRPETDGPLDGPTDEGDILSTLAQVFDAIFPGSIPVPLGVAHDNVEDLFKVKFGADGGCTVCYDLAILCEKTNLRDTETGTCISLVDCGSGVVKGVDECGNVVFAVWVDHDSGKIVSAQFRAIDHDGEEGKPGAHDEMAFLKEGTLGVTAIATDNDGDKDCKTVDISCGISFEDDAPKVLIVQKLFAEIRLDESLAPGAGEPADGNANDETASGDTTDIGYKTVAGSSLFNVLVEDYGSDGAKSKVFSLTIGNSNSGLTDVETNQAVILSQAGNVVTGKVGNEVVFTITIDPTDGDVTVAQFRAVKHDRPGDPDEAGPDLNNSGTDEPQTMSNGALSLTLTLTDGDCDQASSSIDLGKLIKFEDDGPFARNDTDSVTEDSAEDAVGNVFAAGNVATIGGTDYSDTNGTDGVSDDAGTDGLKSIQWKEGAGFDNDGAIAGTYGTLYVNADGGYRYVLNEDHPALATLNDGQKLYENFEYVITDKDDDTSKAKLTITIDGHTDALPPTAENATATVDEDGIPVIGNNDAVSSDDDAEGPTPPDVVGEATWRANLPVNWNGFPGDITLAAGSWSGFKSIDGSDIVEVVSSAGHVLEGYDADDVTGGVPNVGATPVFKVEIINATSGEYQVTLFKPLQHPDNNGNNADNPDDPTSSFEDNLTIPVNVTYTNAGGTVIKSLAINVDDDSPIGYDDAVDVAPGVSGTADILFIVDVSGSMDGEVDDVSGFADTRLGLARYSMQQLLLNHPEILNVQFVKFDGDVNSPTSVWLSRADALTCISNNANFVGGGSTNYDLALGEAIDEYGNSVRPVTPPVSTSHQNLVYFLSDGAPNDGGGIDEEGINAGDNPGTISRQEWEAFVTANNISHVFAIGMGSGVNVGNLEPVAYPNTDSEAPIGDEDHVVVIPTANLTELTETLDALLGTVIPPSIGDALANDDPGADGHGAPELVSVTYGVTTYNFTGGVTEHTIDLGAGRGSLEIHDDGTYTYTPPSDGPVNGAPFFVEYTIRDGDGDTSTAKLLFDLNSPPFTDLNGVVDGDDVAVGFTEQTPVAIAPAATISDDDGTLASMMVTLINRPNGDGVESLSVSPALLPVGVTANYTPATGVLLISGLATVAEYQAILQGIVYSNTSDAPSTTTRTVTVVVNDGTSDSPANTSTITVAPVNDGPDANISAPSYTATEQTGLSLHGTGLSISDVDAGNNDVTVTLSVGSGNLAVSAGNSGVDVDNNNSSSVTLTGTVAQINNLLQDLGTGTIVFTPSGGNNPPASTQLTLHVNDEGNTGGGDLIDSVNVIINITPVNDAPTTTNTNASGSEDAASIQVNLSGSDPDGSVTQFKITSLPTNGKLYADVGLTNEITLNEIVAAAAVFFVPTANFNGPQSFQYAAIDNLGLEDASPATASITVNPVNDPTVANPDSIITAINDDSSFNVPHWALLANDSDPDGPLTINQITAFDGGNTFDSVTTAGGNVTINTDNDFDPGDAGQFTYKAGDATAQVTVAAVANADIIGTANAEIIVDNNNGHTVNAGGGNDIVFGNGGGDTLNGQGGDDVLDGGEGGDTLNGGDGNDILDGGEDGDTFDGGKGDDTFDTSDGHDTIVYNAVANLDAADIVQNFDNEVSGGGHDTVNLDALLDALTVANGDRDDRVSVVVVGSNTELRVDLNGDGSDETTILVFQGIGSTANFTFGNDADNDIKLGTL